MCIIHLKFHFFLGEQNRPKQAETSFTIAFFWNYHAKYISHQFELGNCSSYLNINLKEFLMSPGLCMVYVLDFISDSNLNLNLLGGPIYLEEII